MTDLQLGKENRKPKHLTRCRKAITGPFGLRIGTYLYVENSGKQPYELVAWQAPIYRIRTYVLYL